MHVYYRSLEWCQQSKTQKSLLLLYSTGLWVPSYLNFGPHSENILVMFLAKPKIKLKEDTKMICISRQEILYDPHPDSTRLQQDPKTYFKRKRNY